MFVSRMEFWEDALPDPEQADPEVYKEVFYTLGSRDGVAPLYFPAISSGTPPSTRRTWISSGRMPRVMSRASCSRCMRRRRRSWITSRRHDAGAGRRRWPAPASTRRHENRNGRSGRRHLRLKRRNGETRSLWAIALTNASLSEIVDVLQSLDVDAIELWPRNLPVERVRRRSSATRRRTSPVRGDCLTSAGWQSPASPSDSGFSRSVRKPAQATAPRR